MIRKTLLATAVVTIFILLIAQVAWAAPPPTRIVHIVRWGETLTSIARRYGTTVQAIAALNGIANPNRIFAGQRLVVTTGTVTPTSTSCGTYVVRTGDTLTAIARRFGTTVNAIAQANGIVNPNLIFIGQRLVIPCPAPSPCPQSYVVRTGDTLTAIARRFGTTVNAIAQANGIVNPNLIFIGQRLVIPCPSPAPCPRTYVVRRGDTLTSIALRFGVSVWSIVVANDIPNPNLIFAGQRLVIPC